MFALQMQTQYFLPCIPFFLLFIILMITTSFGQKDVTLFQNCSSPFSCGETFPDIRYPFWGRHRSPECGKEEFHVSCLQGDYLTINISGHTFRLLSLNITTYGITIAPHALWNGGCPEFYTDIPPFYPVKDQTIDLPLYYDCPDRVNDVSRYRFSCTNTRDNNAIVYSFLNDSDCKENISVRALRNEVDKLNRGIASASLEDVLYKGFSVEYSLNWTACFGCMFSKGLCWSGTISAEHTCLCSDGSRNLSVCPLADQIKDATGGTDLPVKLIIALSTVTLCAIALILLACLRYHGWSPMELFIFKTKTKEEHNLEELIAQYGSLAPERYSYSYIKKMTLSFKDKLGQGGYGTVYKGKLLDGRLVAIKLLNVTKESGEEFINEVLSIIRTSHVNVVRLLGFCMEGKKRALVYEYMPNGSLEKHIHSKRNDVSNNQLQMDKLYQISLGVARGLEYLHRGCNTRIMHFDIKPHNILLDEYFHPKISDFGMAKQCKMNESMVSILGARGTIGYIAPELVSRAFGVVSYKSDVYSYGMMILEIVGRRKNVNLKTSHTSEVYFPHWVYQHLVIDKDLRLKDVTPKEDEIARKIILVGLWCVQNDPSQRPTMSKVIEMLEGGLQAIPMPPNSFFGFPSTPPQTSSTTCTTIVTF